MKTDFLHLLLHKFILGLIFILGFTKSDPDPLQDYCIASSFTTENSQDGFFCNCVPCIDPAQAKPSDFATSALSKPGDTQNQSGFNVSVTTVSNLPGLNTLGLSMARIDIGPDGLVPLHSHPRATELTIVLKGSIRVGFVDTSSREFSTELRAGDSFVFPKGLLHYLYNSDSDDAAVTVSGFSSQNPGLQMASSAAAVATNPELLPARFLKNRLWANSCPGFLVDDQIEKTLFLEGKMFF